MREDCPSEQGWERYTEGGAGTAQYAPYLPLSLPNHNLNLDLLPLSSLWPRVIAPEESSRATGAAAVLRAICLVGEDKFPVRLQPWGVWDMSEAALVLPVASGKTFHKTRPALGA